MRAEQTMTYQSFLLRLWRDGEKRPWRASLLDPHTEQVRHFATMRELLRFLEEWSGQGEDSDESIGKSMKYEL